MVPGRCGRADALYVVYQHEWRFSTVWLTVAFAVYAAAVLASLLFAGDLSDRWGRRPVLAAALIMESVALGLFLCAASVAAVAAARLVQGAATGAALAALSATLVDLEPPQKRISAGSLSAITPLIGLAVGGLGSGVLLAYGPAPTRLVFAVLLAGAVLAGPIVASLPRTGPRKSTAAKQPRLVVPRAVRSDALALAPAFVAAWLLDGAYLSLGPSLAVAIFGLHSPMVGGVLVAAFCGSGAVAEIVLRRRSQRHIVRDAGVLLACGTSRTVAGVETGEAAFAALGTVVAGLGFGAAQLGAFGTVARAASPESRSALFSVAFVVSYVCFGPPAVVAGLAASSVPVRDVVLAWGVTVIALSTVTTWLAQPDRNVPARRSGSTERRQDPDREVAVVSLASGSRLCDAGRSTRCVSSIHRHHPPRTERHVLCESNPRGGAI